VSKWSALRGERNPVLEKRETVKVEKKLTFKQRMVAYRPRRNRPSVLGVKR
jgi:hypothetical protein